MLTYNGIKEDRLQMTELEKLLYRDTENYEGAYLHGQKCGLRKGKQEDALNMLKHNLSIDLVADCTGLNKKEIIKMKETLKIDN